jgi:elongation factor 2
MLPAHKITSVVAHIDHGKTTLIDSLVASQGYISKSLAGELRYLDSRKDKQERGITLKLSPIKLKNGHVIIDTPGHVDFESLIFCSSILAGNHLILVDVNEGITPRTFSLIKFLKKDRCILVLNKTDKCLDFSSIEMVIQQMNGLFGDEVFEWSKNNIILSCASLCSGINFRLFKSSKNNTIKTAFKAFSLLTDKFEQNNIEDLLKKYNIKFRTKKALFSTIFPLTESVFDCIDHLVTNKLINSDESNNKDDLVNSIENISIIESNSKIIRNKFYTISFDSEPELLAITVYGMLKEKMINEKSNVLFITKILKSTIKKGDWVYSIENKSSFKMVEVFNIHELIVDTFVEIDQITGPGLACLRGDFSKNSVISNIPVDFKMNDFLAPFFKAKLVPLDLNQLQP